MAEHRVEAVERALSFLEAFDEHADTLTLSELTRRTGLYKSTILRLAASLERYGYLYREASGGFRLGAAVWRLGSLYRRGFDLGEHIRPALRELVSATSETASFHVREGTSRVCLYRLNSSQAIRHHLDEGVRLPLERGAAGRVLLAFGGARGEPYETILMTGHHVSLGERDPEIAAVAVPVFDIAGDLRGALAVSALIRRFDEAARERALNALRRTARQLSRSLPAP